MLTYGLTAPAMFAGLIVFLLVGFPVAFSLAALGLFFGVIAIELGYFSVSFLQALPYRTFSTARASSSARCRAAWPTR